MAKVVKKKRKLGGRVSAGPSARETSNLRPFFAPKVPACADRCPNHTDIRGMLTTIALAEKKNISYEEAFEQAWRIVVQKNPLPAVCGRVCPHPCEEACNRNEKEGAVGINNVERFIGDFALQRGFPLPKASDEKHPEKIAVIGSGPAGLSCAYQLARRGYAVTIFEAFSKPGGMLRYGIPPYRLPRHVLDAEIQRVLEMGVELKRNTAIGRDVPYERLQKDFKAIFVGIGAHKGRSLGCPGEDAENVFTGTEFLNRVNSGEAVEVGDKVYVIGGGDTAIDAARVSKRLGADVTILYRRTVKEMPAIPLEIEEAQQEGIKMEFLAAPVELVKNNGRAVKMKAIRMELKEADSSGRPRPVPIDGSEFEVDVTCVIAAISQEPDFTGLERLHEGKDWVKADEHGQTPLESTWAGGDALELGLATIAIAQGRYAAEAIDAHLRGRQMERPEPLPVIKADKVKLDWYEKAERHQTPTMPVEQRFKNPEAETTSTLSQDDIIAESKRCMSCGFCFDCGTCWSFCQDNAVVKPTEPGQPYKFKMEFCQGCKKCAEECPCGYIEMQ
jgi:NADPH-dependent glutamate synthase beta subunit-like oxidoreductase/Pyruvate/2-oxoacid:ferredoxin oxidoreductase delta subunit